MENPSKINAFLRAAENGAAEISEQQHRKRAISCRHRPLSASRPAPQILKKSARSTVLALFSFCVPTLHTNHDRNRDIVLNALIAAFVALGVEHHMTGKVLGTQDFYEFPLCSNTIVSTWHEEMKSTSFPRVCSR